MLILSDTQLSELASQIADKLRGHGFDAGGSAIDVPRRMNATMFGICIGRCAAVVKRRIRSRFIDRALVEGRRGSEYLIDRAALARFNVPLELASQRLRAWQTQSSLAQIPAPAPRTNGA